MRSSIKSPGPLRGPIAAWTSDDFARASRTWARAAPYPHVVIDSAWPEDTLQRLREAMAAEPHWPMVDEITTAMASTAPPAHAGLRAFIAETAAGPVRRALAAATGLALGDLELRSYVFLPGQALLPHADHRPGLGRRLAFVLYLGATPGGGGTLWLHAGDRRELSIEPKAGRLVVFDVGAASVHEVAEITAGARLSLAGWFHAPDATPWRADPLGTGAPDAPAPNHAVLRDATPLAGARLAALRRLVERASFRNEARPVWGRFAFATIAPLDVAAALGPSLAGIAPDLGPLRSAVLVRYGPGGYVLGRGLDGLRPPELRWSLAVELSADAVVGGGELAWEGARGVVAVAPCTPGRLTVVRHGREVGQFGRRIPHTATGGGEGARVRTALLGWG